MNKTTRIRKTIDEKKADISKKFEILQISKNKSGEIVYHVKCDRCGVEYIY